MQAWGDHIIGRLRPKAKALFQAGRFVGVDGDRAVFGLPNEMHRNRCQEVQGESRPPCPTTSASRWGSPWSSTTAPRRQPDRRTHRTDRQAGAGLLPVAFVLAALAGSGSVDSDRDCRRAGTTCPSRRSGPVPSVAMADHDDDDEEEEDGSAFDESELGEIADIDNSAEARVLQAFPGAEEVL